MDLGADRSSSRGGPVFAALHLPPSRTERHGHIFRGKLRPLRLYPAGNFLAGSPTLGDDLIRGIHDDRQEVAGPCPGPLDALPLTLSGWSRRAIANIHHWFPRKTTRGPAFLKGVFDARSGPSLESVWA